MAIKATPLAYPLKNDVINAEASMDFTYKEIISYYEQEKKLWIDVLKDLEETIIEARDNFKSPLPIYLTKHRIKNPDSIFLKTKRKSFKSLNEIKDFAGIRILTLFEKDIFEINNFLVKKFCSEKFYSLKEVTTYNWESSLASNMFSQLVTQDCNAKKIIDFKDSGYKSVHYIVDVEEKGKKCSIEVQVRTLLQDVWGELEHSLSYKQGSVHPHIKKSFVLLAENLSTNDSLISHLRNIRDKENAGHIYSLSQIKPYGYMHYEEAIIPKIFKDKKFSNHHKKYISYISKKNKSVSHADWIENGKKYLEALVSPITQRQLKADICLNYWIEMEKAYFLFHECKLDEAMEIYKKLRSGEFYCRPVLHFRIGEIYFIKNNLEKSLAAFDTSESCLNDDSTNIQNKYRIKLKLAYTYWLLGEEYFPVVTKVFCEAKNIFETHRELFSEGDHHVVINGACWYFLEKYIVETRKNKSLERLSSLKNDKDLKKKIEASKTKAANFYKESKKYYDQLEKLLEIPSCSSNLFDTAAWFCYHSHLAESNAGWLEKSKNYCKKIQEKENRATLKLKSQNIQTNHMLEIITAT